jgi:alpha-beta hydrolase superfamily lysophospholipase
MGKANNDALDPDTHTKWYSNDLNKDAEIDCLIESSINKETDKPDLRLACPTSNWLDEAFESTDIVMDNAKELQTPTLIVRAVKDNAVDNDGQTEFCKLTKNCTIFDVTIVGGVQTGHELLIEKEPIRKVFLDLFDGFVQNKNQ